MTGSLQIENALKVWENTENVGSTERGSVYSDTPQAFSQPLDTFQLLTQESSDPGYDEFYVKKILGQDQDWNLIQRTSE